MRNAESVPVSITSVDKQTFDRRPSVRFCATICTEAYAYSHEWGPAHFRADLYASALL